ncbi:conserved hypothetical protein [Uncinocarpus reesii 1704]|uniref:Calcium transporter n=1 Tax=Uncinocarpus reesii (strain UAMH 1704) TaxID=336963 RepID=C4JTQ0_UNCRE|nr:uncharacterized protein UREG_05839 [Uncinocarpus reesii 1704]EEP80997.1 conserved hypothetical protein [Uncinocarpus reesii 1704]
MALFLVLKRLMYGPANPSLQERLRQRLERGPLLPHRAIGDDDPNRRLLDVEAQTHATLDHTGNEITNAPTRVRVNPKIVSDAILGLSDGLTVPFALSAGLSALGETRFVVVGGLAELAAGAISMGLGGFVGAKSELESYRTTRRETEELINAAPDETANRVRQVFARFGVPERIVTAISDRLHNSPDLLMEFLLVFHHREVEPNCNQPWISALTLAVCYFVGGFIPLIPYFCVKKVFVAFYWSVGVMAITLLIFGYIKTCVVRGWRGKENIVAGLKGGLQMIFVGGLAARGCNCLGAWD